MGSEIFAGARVALVHDRLLGFGGGEQVLGALLELWPRADIFTLLADRGGPSGALVAGRTLHTSFLQSLPGSRLIYRNLLPLMPLAVEQLDLRGYDLIISNSHTVAKGVLTSPEQLHLSYILSPMRYAWDMQAEYLEGLGFRSTPARLLLQALRGWDVRTAQAIDRLACASIFVQRRINKYYRRDAEVIYPPVAVTALPFQEEKEDYYICVCRAVPYKRLDLIMEAFARSPTRRLVLVGAGPELRRLQRLAPPNVQLLGWQPRDTMAGLLTKARGFVYAAREDFGISIVEAQACGTPVIAYRAGGAVETVLEGETGIFFNEQSAEAIGAALDAFEQRRATWDATRIRNHAQKFDHRHFLAQFTEFARREFDAFQHQSYPLR